MIPCFFLYKNLQTNSGDKKIQASDTLNTLFSKKFYKNFIKKYSLKDFIHEKVFKS